MFKIGQKVVCIDATGSDNLIKNEIYTIKDFWFDNNGNACLLEEAEPNIGHYAFYPKRFKPLKYDLISNKEIIKEMVTEKLDIPIKEFETIK